VESKESWRNLDQVCLVFTWLSPQNDQAPF
jgi:hypothetical protein